MDSSRDIVRKLRENRILNERNNYEKMDRDELITLAQDGDQLALETLVNTHQDMIINYTRKYHLDTGDFDDIKQYVTIAFWEAVKTWDHTGNFEAYAGMIIKRKMSDVLRHEDTGKNKINTDSDSLDATRASDDEGGETTLGASLPSKSLSPEEEYLGRDGANKIMKFMEEQLSETERKVIMRYIQGYKYDEISDELGIKYRAAENAVRRVKDKLAEYLRNVRESRKMTMNESIFSDEEKQILTSILNKIDNKVDIQESTDIKSIKDMSEEEIYDTIVEYEDELDELKDTIKDTVREEDLDAAIDRADEILDTLIGYEDFIDSNELLKKCKEVQRKAMSVADTYPESFPEIDPYKDRGLSPTDFF